MSPSSCSRCRTLSAVGGRHYRQPGGYQRGETDHGSATKAGIPLVFVNRRPQAELTDKMAYVGSDSILAGRLQMEALAKAMNGKGNVAILLGDRRMNPLATAPKGWKRW